MVYELRKYDMKGKVLYTQKEHPELEAIEGKHGKKDMFVYKGTTQEYMKSWLWELTTTPKQGALPASDEFLPYFADVTEDLPSSMWRHTAKTYNNCQLMVETHGSYHQFYHAPTKSILRIAMNSHTYQPTK